jgi:hypothetical protein
MTNNIVSDVTMLQSVPQISSVLSCETVDCNQDLTVKCANIKSLFESQTSPLRIQQESNLPEDEIRRIRGVIVDNKTNQIVHKGSFFPYEYTESEQDKCLSKMEELNHKFDDLTVQYSFEGTIIRIFYYKKWYFSTHRKLDSGTSKWGSNKSFKSLFEEGLKEGYDISLKDLVNLLNLRCQYTFMVVADENTRFVCTSDLNKKVYFVDSNDPNISLKVDKLPNPNGLNSLTQIFEYVKGTTYPFTHQGILLTHVDGAQYRIISDEYAKLFKVRNNEQSIPYRFIQLRTENNLEYINLLKKLFPKYTTTFEEYDKYIKILVDTLYIESTKRKLNFTRDNLPQIDQKFYLFIKNKLLKVDKITHEQVEKLLMMEEPSYINQMIRTIKYNQRKEEKDKLTINFVDVIDDNVTDDKPEKKKKIKYTRVPKYVTVPVEFIVSKSKL